MSMPTPRTEFLDGLVEPSPDSSKTRIVLELMGTKPYPPEQVKLLGCAREEGWTFYYFAVPGAIIEIEIKWDANAGKYQRRFSNVIDDESELIEMIGFVPR